MGRAAARARHRRAALPLIEIAPPADPRRGRRPRGAALPATRAGRVRQPERGRALLRCAPAGRRAWPAALQAASPGPGTTQRCSRSACRRARSSSRPPTRRSSIPRRCGRSSRRATGAARSVLIVRGDGGRDWLAERLRAAGARRSTSWRPTARRAPRLDGAAQRALLRDALRRPAAHLLALQQLARRSTTWPRLVPGADWSARARAGHASAHRATRARAGLRPTSSRRAPTLDAVVAGMQSSDREYNPLAP